MDFMGGIRLTILIMVVLLGATILFVPAALAYQRIRRRRQEPAKPEAQRSIDLFGPRRR